jgi:hemolysin III
MARTANTKATPQLAWHELVGKPLLRGYLHAAAAVAAIVIGTLLVLAARPDIPKQLTIAVFAGSSVLLFGTSATYHAGRWDPRVEAVLRRIDHANIYVLIAGTYTPICYNLLSGWTRPAMLIAIWTIALAGVAMVTQSVRLPDWAVATIYIVMGWLGLATTPGIGAAVGVGGVMMILAAGALYSIGAAAYAWKRPRLWPRVFSYHEVFHLCTVLASAMFFIFVAAQVVPFHRS